MYKRLRRCNYTEFQKHFLSILGLKKKQKTNPDDLSITSVELEFF